MPLDHTARAVGKAKHPILLAICVVVVILASATAYTFVGRQPASDDPGGQAPSLGSAPRTAVGPAVAER